MPLGTTALTGANPSKASYQTGNVIAWLSGRTPSLGLICPTMAQFTAFTSGRLRPATPARVPQVMHGGFEIKGMPN
jgi:hypothetical protein